MIFWFSGTGNSYHAAKAVQERFGGCLVSMAEAVREKKFSYSFGEGEKVFFVFPVYFAGLPGTVDAFLDGFQPSGGAAEYIGIATCGASCGAADRALAKRLASKGLSLRAFYDVVMPENCIFWLKTPIRENALMTLKHSDQRLKDVLDSIEFRHRMPYHSSLSAGALGRFLHSFYHRMNGTRAFRVTDRCTGCGICAENCPVRAIEMKDGRPVWTSRTCVKCAGCINRCPAKAIEYGRFTKNRYRYAHPDFALGEGPRTVTPEHEGAFWQE